MAKVGDDLEEDYVTPPNAEEANLVELTRNWSPKAKAKAMDALRLRTSESRQVWYCTDPGPLCDGQPHPGFDYPHARADQWPPRDSEWFIWALIGGRGSGKTRSGSEFTRKMSGRVGRMALIAPTSADVRDTMIEGDSGLISVCEKAGESIKWEPSKRKVTFANGCIAGTFSAEEPDRLRGPQHGYAWLDEPAHMPAIIDVWDMMLFGLRLGQRPVVAMTTTPRPTKWLKARLAEATTRKSKVSTYANITNLAPTFRDQVLSRYEGTRLGLQELHGELLEDVEGALWNQEIIHRMEMIDINELERVVVGVDPAGSTNNKSDETGIIVMGKLGDHGYVLADYTDKYSPNGWANKAIWAAEKWGATAIVAEKNYGGDMVRTTIMSALKLQKKTMRIIVATAAKSKSLRAEPVVARYEQGAIFHCGDLAKLEDEQLTWVPEEGKSPNRIDALVWAATELLKLGGMVSISSPTGSTMRRGQSGMHTRQSGFQTLRRYQ